MRPATEQYLVTGLVLFGSLVLFGPATGVAVLVATARLGELVGVILTAETALGLALFGLAVLAGLATSTEAAAVRLGGPAALHRGDERNRYVRYATLALVGLAALVAVGSFLFEATVWSVRRGRVEYVVLLAAVAIAVGWVAVRTGLAFRRGLRGKKKTEPLA